MHHNISASSSLRRQVYHHAFSGGLRVLLTMWRSTFECSGEVDGARWHTGEGSFFIKWNSNLILLLELGYVGNHRSLRELDDQEYISKKDDRNDGVCRNAVALRATFPLTSSTIRHLGTAWIQLSLPTRRILALYPSE